MLFQKRFPPFPGHFPLPAFFKLPKTKAFTPLETLNIKPNSKKNKKKKSRHYQRNTFHHFKNSFSACTKIKCTIERNQKPKLSLKNKDPPYLGLKISKRSKSNWEQVGTVERLTCSAIDDNETIHRRQCRTRLSSRRSQCLKASSENPNSVYI